ncbi:hypothetical protein ACIHEJ_09510 [Streptomyces sp. NPDC052301]|uniref:hypothetical protein n=1 Tax=Streptomyces sp. NPDC052301 TaxID=3365687 RepID=UPI0037D6FA88
MPSPILLAAGRADLVVHSVGGSTCALYGHSPPCAARARAPAAVVLGRAASGAVGPATAAATNSTVVRCAAAAVLAAAHRLVCEATRIGPPDHAVLTFVAAGCALSPQHCADIPGHLGLALAAACSPGGVQGPGLGRPREPRRLAAARTLDAAVRLARTQDDDPAHASACRTADTAAAEAGRTLPLTAVRSPEGEALMLPLVHAASGRVGPGPRHPHRLRARTARSPS